MIHTTNRRHAADALRSLHGHEILTISVRGRLTAVRSDAITAVIDRYRDTRGVFLWLLGNENNYGLSWTSFEAEALRKFEHVEPSLHEIFVHHAGGRASRQGRTVEVAHA